MKLNFPAVLAAVIAVASALGAGSASAATFAGAVTDPADGRYAATDVRSESVTFDNSTGVWKTTYVFRGPVLSTTNVQIYVSMRNSVLNQFGQPQALAFFEIAVRKGKMSYIRRYSGRPTVSLTRIGKVLTLIDRDPYLIGLIPSMQEATRLSYKTVTQNWVSPIPLVKSP